MIRNMKPAIPDKDEKLLGGILKIGNRYECLDAKNNCEECYDSLTKALSD